MLLQRPVLSYTCPSDRRSTLNMPSGLPSWHMLSSSFFYPGISSEPLNLSQQKFARWRQLVRNRIWWVWIFEFLRGLGWGPKCHFLPGFARSDLHKLQYGAKTENDIKNRKLSCSGQIISLPNGENRAKIGQGTAEILGAFIRNSDFFSLFFEYRQLWSFITSIRLKIEAYNQRMKCCAWKGLSKRI